MKITGIVRIEIVVYTRREYSLDFEAVRGETASPAAVYNIV